MNISSKPTDTAKPKFDREPIGNLVRKWLAKCLPPKIPIGALSMTAHIEQWEPGANYTIAGKQVAGAESFVLTLAEHFANHGGHVIWVGITDDLHDMSERLMFKIAGIELPAVGFTIQLDAVAQCKLKHAHEQISKMWIDFCNVDDCGDKQVEEVFLASMSSFKPTLIVVSPSLFDEAVINPFGQLVRQTHALRMVEELRRTNPMSSTLWNISTPNNVAATYCLGEPG